MAFVDNLVVGKEKLATEELCKHYNKDFGIECRIGRFHNIYGPFGTWKGMFFTELKAFIVLTLPNG